jgi:hypothetical protein
MLKERNDLAVGASAEGIEAEIVVDLTEIALVPKFCEDCNFCVQEFVPLERFLFCKKENHL